jgi:hypothetical protein
MQDYSITTTKEEFSLTKLIMSKSLLISESIPLNKMEQIRWAIVIDVASNNYVF